MLLDGTGTKKNKLKEHYNVDKKAENGEPFACVTTSFKLWTQI